MTRKERYAQFPALVPYPRRPWRIRRNALVSAKQQRNVAAMREAKQGPCVDCHHTFHPCQMDFDHVRGVKLACVSTLGGYSGAQRPARLVAEMAKCDLVCANCHRLRTFFRRQQAEPTTASIVGLGTDLAL